MITYANLQICVKPCVCQEKSLAKGPKKVSGDQHLEESKRREETRDLLHRFRGPKREGPLRNAV